MNSKRPSVVKSTAKAGAGGAVVIAAVLALLFFRGGGGPPGADNDSTAGVSQPSLASTEKDPPPTEVAQEDKSPSEIIGGLTADEEKALSEKVLAILIDERSYLMQVPTDGEALYRPAELDRLLELAKHVEGDSNGIRVRILQRETARVSAHQELVTRLDEIGIGTDAVYSQAEFIP